MFTSTACLDLQEDRPMLRLKKTVFAASAVAALALAPVTPAAAAGLVPWLVGRHVVGVVLGRSADAALAAVPRQRSPRINRPLRTHRRPITAGRRPATMRRQTITHVPRCITHPRRRTTRDARRTTGRASHTLARCPDSTRRRVATMHHARGTVPLTVATSPTDRAVSLIAVGEDRRSPALRARRGGRPSRIDALRLRGRI